MSNVVLIFANLSRQDAHVWALADDGEPQFVAKLGSGATVRHLSETGKKWSIVANDGYSFTVGDKNRIFIIGSSGVYEVENARPLTADSGVIPGDFDFASFGGGGWP